MLRLDISDKYWIDRFIKHSRILLIESQFYAYSYSYPNTNTNTSYETVPVSGPDCTLGIGYQVVIKIVNFGSWTLLGHTSDRSTLKIVDARC